MALSWKSRKSLRKPRVLVAVAWDHRELLALIAEPIRGGCAVVDSLAIPLGTVSSERPQTLGDAGKALAAALAERGIRAYQLLVGLPRSHVEMATLELPPATAAEIPELVRNEMMRRFSDLPEEVVVDFQYARSSSASTTENVSSSPDERPVVEAAALRPDTQIQLRSFTQALGCEPTRIVIRSLAIASLFRQQIQHLPQRSLLLNVTHANADLSVLDLDRITFTRSIHLTTQGPDATPDAVSLADEIRLTLIVAPQSPQDAQDEPAMVEHVYMFTDLNGRPEFVGQLAEEIQLPVTLLDPLEGIEVRGGRRPEETNRLAAHAGMIWDYLNRHTGIDFANPKQPPPVRKVERKWFAYAGAAGAALVIIVYFLRGEVRELQQQVDSLAVELEGQQQLLKKLRGKTAVLDGLDRWEAAEIHWLEELRGLSARFPQAGQAVVQRMTMAPTSGNRGIVSMSVRVDDPERIASLERGLRDERHQVSSQRISQAGGGDGELSCQFETSVVVAPAARQDAQR